MINVIRVVAAIVATAFAVGLLSKVYQALVFGDYLRNAPPFQATLAILSPVLIVCGFIIVIKQLHKLR